MSGRGTIWPGHCHGCHREVMWVKMGPTADGSPGGTMPCERPWSHGDGKKTLIVPDDDHLGRTWREAPEGVVGRESHWPHCPARERFKKKKPKDDKPAQGSLF